jgi:hypothetical protein
VRDAVNACLIRIFRSRQVDLAFLCLLKLLFAGHPGDTSMSKAAAPLSATEGIASERELLNGETSPLRAATGFVIGGTLCGAFWIVAGLLVWFLA